MNSTIGATDSRSESIAVVSTQCAHTDRRALSQAWYSALHVAQRDASPGAPRRMRIGVSVDKGATPVIPNHPDGARPTPGGAPARANVPSRRDVAVPAAAIERRTPKSDLAKRIERAVVTNGRRAGAAASLAIRAADGRVQLVVRTQGDATRIVALCAPELEARVARALAQARFALATRGVRTEVSC
jgi:hypothetical protein